jgi:hypothetical protein
MSSKGAPDSAGAKQHPGDLQCEPAGLECSEGAGEREEGCCVRQDEEDQSDQVTLS